MAIAESALTHGRRCLRPPVGEDKQTCASAEGPFVPKEKNGNYI